MKHPENLEEINSIKVTDEVKDFVAGVSSEIQQANSDKGEWSQRDEEYYRKRYGLRRQRNHPWPGAANFVLPLIDTDIARAKPAYVNLVNVDPIVAFEPFGAEDIDAGRKRELLLDYRLKHKMNFMKPYIMGVDMMLQKGFTIFKVIWKFKSRKYTEAVEISEFPDVVIDALYAPETTDNMLKKILQEEFSIDFDFEENITAIDDAVKQFREGKTRLELTLFEKAYNAPDLIVCDPKEDLTVPTDTTDIQDARWIDYKFYLSKNDIKIAIRDGKYHSFTDDVIESWVGKATFQNNISQLAKEGINRNVNNDELALMHETCVMYDIDGDGIEEKCICTWPDNDPSAVLRFIELPYEHGQWPYVQVRREITDPSFYSSRGIPALDDDFQTGLSSLFNNDLNNQTVVSTPYIVYRRNSVKNIRNIKYVPGQAFEVDDPNAFDIRQHVNTSQATFINSQRLLKAWANERLGTPAQAVTGDQNQQGQGQNGRRTAAEVNLVAGLHGQSQSVDLLIFQIQMADVYYQIDALYMQFGPQEEFMMTGEEPIRIKRREIQGRFNLSPNGTLDNSNPVVRSQKTFLMFQAFRGDPDIKQEELKKAVLADVDPRLVKRLMFSPEEKQMMAQQRMAQMEQMKQKGLAEGIDLKRIESTLDLEHEAGLAIIQGRKFAPDPQRKGRDSDAR